MCWLGGLNREEKSQVILQQSRWLQFKELPQPREEFPRGRYKKEGKKHVYIALFVVADEKDDWKKALKEGEGKVASTTM